jgi:hypothetical protein
MLHQAAREQQGNRPGRAGASALVPAAALLHADVELIADWLSQRMKL